MKKEINKVLAIAAEMTMASALFVGCGGDTSGTTAEPDATTEEVSTEATESGDYLSNGDYVYEDPNGWKVRYNPDLITVNKENNIVGFVYTGDCAGTCMVQVTYDVYMNGKEKSEALAKEYGDAATVSESVFPGTEDEKCYVVYCPSADGSTGLFMTALVRDYMDGYLLFEELVTNSGDEEMDMAVSDNLATIIDSLEFVSP